NCITNLFLHAVCSRETFAPAARCACDLPCPLEQEHALRLVIPRRLAAPLFWESKPLQRGSFLLLSPLLLVLFHDRARRHFFGALAVASRALRALFNMLVLLLL